VSKRELRTCHHAKETDISAKDGLRDRELVSNVRYWRVRRDIENLADIGTADEENRCKRFIISISLKIPHLNIGPKATPRAGDPSNVTVAEVAQLAATRSKQTGGRIDALLIHFLFAPLCPATAESSLSKDVPVSIDRRNI
jgi:hypothetical protein